MYFIFVKKKIVDSNQFLFELIKCNLFPNKFQITNNETLYGKIIF